MRIFIPCFLLVKFNNDDVVLVRRRLEVRKNSGAAFGLAKIMLNLTFHSFILSLQPPTYNAHENNTNGNLHMHNAVGYETLAAPMHGENPNQLYTRVHIVNNPRPTSSVFLEPLGIAPKVVYALGNVRPKISACAPKFCPIFMKPTRKNFIGNASKTSDNGSATNYNWKCSITPTCFCNFAKR